MKSLRRAKVVNIWQCFHNSGRVEQKRVTYIISPINRSRPIIKLRRLPSKIAHWRNSKRNAQILRDIRINRSRMTRYWAAARLHHLSHSPIRLSRFKSMDASGTYCHAKEQRRGPHCSDWEVREREREGQIYSFLNVKRKGTSKR
jgi:hypothetical protein